MQWLNIKQISREREEEKRARDQKDFRLETGAGEEVGTSKIGSEKVTGDGST